jgi:small subunit ribosomal protein S7
VVKKKKEDEIEQPPPLPERVKVTGRGIKPDPKYGDMLVSKFINCMMWDGKKNVAARAFYEAMDMVAEKTGANPIEVFTTAINNVKPVVEVKSRRVGGATYQVPVEVNRKRAQSLAIRWIVQIARSKKGRPMARKLADEILAAYKKEGDAIKKREDTHKMAEANKAFAHFAW